MNYRTKEELIQEWLDAYPEDKDSPDLELLALAGTVRTPQGYLPFSEWNALRLEKKGRMP